MLKSLFNWFLQRLPINEFIARHLTQYYLPKNLNFWYFFGSLALFLLFLQVLTGLWLTMFYTPTPEAAFNSIETMMREIHHEENNYKCVIEHIERVKPYGPHLDHLVVDLLLTKIS